MPGQSAFLSVRFDSTNSLHYFNVYFNRNHWVFVLRKNLQDALFNAYRTNRAIVYAEGYGKTLPGGLDRATRLTRTYLTLTIFFDWPTYDPAYSQTKNYYLTIETSKKASLPFSELLNQLEALKVKGGLEYQSMSLILHSMGNLLMENAIQKHAFQLKDTLFNAIILNAACTKKTHHRQWVEKITFSQSVYITLNNKDGVLRLAKILSFRQQLGLHAGHHLAKNATYINFSRDLTSEHNYFLYSDVLREHPKAKNMYRTLFAGKKPIFSNTSDFQIQRRRQCILVLPETKP
jgi:hypothetical protein